MIEALYSVLLCQDKKPTLLKVFLPKIDNELEYTQVKKQKKRGRK